MKFQLAGLQPEVHKCLPSFDETSPESPRNQPQNNNLQFASIWLFAICIILIYIMGTPAVRLQFDPLRMEDIRK